MKKEYFEAMNKIGDELKTMFIGMPNTSDVQTMMKHAIEQCFRKAEYSGMFHINEEDSIIFIKEPAFLQVIILQEKLMLNKDYHVYLVHSPRHGGNQYLGDVVVKSGLEFNEEGAKQDWYFKPAEPVEYFTINIPLERENK